MPNQQFSDLAQPPEIERQTYDDAARAVRVLPKGHTAGGLFVDLLADADGTLHVAGSVTTTPSAAEHAEDTPHVSGDVGIQMLAVRNDASSSLAADGDYHVLEVTSRGELKVNVQNATVATTVSGNVSTLANHPEDDPHLTGDFGNFIQGVRNDSAATTLTDADGDYSGIAVDLKGRVHVTATQLPAALAAGGGLKIEGVAGGVTVPVTEASAAAIKAAVEIMDDWDVSDRCKVDIQRAATSTVTSVGDAATSGTLLAANAARLGATLYNNSNSEVFVKFGTTASATDFTVRIAPKGFYELPGPVVYSGRIDAIWTTDAGGSMLCTELTA